MAVKINGKTLSQALWGKESYGLLFVLLLGDYTILTLVNSVRWGGLVRVVPVALTVLFAMHTSSAPRRVLRVAQFSVVLSFGAGIVLAITADQTVGAISFLLVGLLLIVTPVAILRRVLPKDTVDIESLFAAVDVYIIIGLIFSVLFIAIAYISHRYGFEPFLAQPPPTVHPVSDYVYLSFVTLTTVGFGDITPLSALARSVVVLEALIGQIFLVTLVARLVSLYSREGAGQRFISRERASEQLDTPGAPATGDAEPS